MSDHGYCQGQVVAVLMMGNSNLTPLTTTPKAHSEFLVDITTLRP